MALTLNKFVEPDGAPATGRQPMKSSLFGPTDFTDLDTHNKEASSTSISVFDGFSINADTTKFDHTEIKLQVVDNTNPLSQTITHVTVPAATGITDAHLTTANITYIGVDVTGAIIQSATQFTAVQRRTTAPLGNIGHPDRATITTVFGFPAYGLSIVNQVHDLMRAIGPINSGNVYSANGTNLILDKTAGSITAMGLGFDDSKLAPNTRQVAALSPVPTFLYVLRDGTNASATAIDPEFYDLAGVKTATPANKFTIQLIVMFSGGFTNVLWGQEL